jgi:hypothetical protein
VKEFFKGLFSKIADAVKSFWQGPGGRIARDAVANAIRQIGPVVFSTLLEAAKRKVAALEPVNMDGDLKAAQVKSLIRDLAIGEGVNLTERLVNQILETAVAAIEPQN